jgi:hypothetical protein
MWHEVNFVATIMKLPKADLVDFALSHECKYGIIIENGDAMVSTFNCDDLIKDFRKLQAEISEADSDAAALVFLDAAETAFANGLPYCADERCEFDV